MLKFEENHWWFSGRREILNSYLNRLKINKNSKIFEIGCGTGSNLNMLSKHGNVTAMEPSDVAVYHLKKKNIENIQFFKGSCPEDLSDSKKYDLICMFDVLEHISGDKEAVLKSLSMLNKNGRLFITVPAYQWLWSTHDENLMHKRRYTKDSLISLFQDVNVIEEHFTYFNTILFPFAILDRVKKNFFKRYDYEENLPNIFINYIFKKIFIFEKFLLNFFSFSFGLSIILIIKKNK